MDFEVVEEPTDVETIATGNRIRELRRLYGKGRWRKMTGVPAAVKASLLKAS
jgi:hypothetical protein